LFSGAFSEDEQDDRDLLTTSSDNWSMEQNKELLKQINELLPNQDTVSYIKTINKFDWSQIKIGQYTKDEIKAHFTNLISSVRKYRSLREVIADCDINNWKKTHLDLPKRPMSAYNLFFKEKYETARADVSGTVRKDNFSYKIERITEDNLYFRLKWQRKLVKCLKI
jgi:hypothetical protein